MIQKIECSNCGAEIAAQMRFCSSCGKRLHARSRGFILGGFTIALVLLASGFGLQTLLRGNRPAAIPIRGQTTQQQVDPHESQTESAQLAVIRKEVEGAPDDIDKLKAFAGMLGDSLRSNPTASPALVFEAIDVFGRILQREPNDPAALVMMADVSFDQRAFTKALDFYERYLKVDPDDLGARSRYASTLTFLGRYDDSIRELGRVLAVDPKNFPAMAYLAITYAQKGDLGTAKKVGGDALAAAPSEDARARFSAFVESLGTESSQGRVGGSEKVDTLNSTNDAKANTPERSSAGDTPSFVATLKSNPIAGPKFVSYERSGSTLKLFYRDFPMSQMPPFAKEKFVGGVKSALTQNGIVDVAAIAFLDASSGMVMDTVVVEAR